MIGLHTALRCVRGRAKNTSNAPPGPLTTGQTRPIPGQKITATARCSVERLGATGPPFLAASTSSR